MKSFKEFLIGELKHPTDYIDESRRSLGRLAKHIRNDPVVIIISVERSPYKRSFDPDIPGSREKAIKAGKYINDVNTESFRQHLRTIGAGYINVAGSYKERYTAPDGKQELVTVKERSTIVYTTQRNRDNVIAVCKQWATKTQQDSILIVNQGKGVLWYPSDNHTESVGDFHPRKIGEYYTIVHGRDGTDNVKAFTFANDQQKLVNKIEDIFNYDVDRSYSFG